MAFYAGLCRLFLFWMLWNEADFVSHKDSASVLVAICHDVPSELEPCQSHSRAVVRRYNSHPKVPCAPDTMSVESSMAHRPRLAMFSHRDIL